MLRRRVTTNTTQCCSSGVDEWKLFESKLMRECVDGSVRVEVMLLICIAAEFSVRGYGGPDWAAAISGTVITFLGLCLKHYVKLRVAESSFGSLSEWTCCIVFNGLSVLLFLCMLTWRSSQIPNQLQAHKGFVSGLIVCLAGSVHMHYLPVKWHIALVSLPSISAHFYFHWYMDFLNRSSMSYAFFWPAFGLACYRYLQSREWSGFQSMRREQELRTLSEAWEVSLRTMLKSVFDATCECDASGRLLDMSPQFAELFGVTIEQSIDSHITSFAYDSNESQRVSTFLSGIANANGRNCASGGVAAKLDASFRFQMKSTKIALTLCGVALPYEQNGSSTLRLLIAWQKSSLQHIAQSASASSYCVPETQTLRDEDLVAQGDALKDLHSFDFKNIWDIDETSSLAFSFTNETSIPAYAIATKSIGTQTDGSHPSKELLNRPKPPALPQAKVRKLPVHSGFKATPSRTLQLFLCDFADRTNPGVTSCCKLHAFLYWISLTMKTLKARDCSDKWCNAKKPWQCQQCFVMNEYPDDDEGDKVQRDQLECIFCGFDCPLASSCSSCDADQSRGNDSAQSDFQTDEEDV